MYLQKLDWLTGGKTSYICRYSFQRAIQTVVSCTYSVLAYIIMSTYNNEVYSGEKWGFVTYLSFHFLCQSSKCDSLLLSSCSLLKNIWIISAYFPIAVILDQDLWDCKKYLRKVNVMANELILVCRNSVLEDFWVKIQIPENR